MIFRVEDAVFAPKAEPEVDKLTLLRNAARRRHTLLVLENPFAVATGQSHPYLDKWVLSLDRPLRKEVGLLFESLKRVSANAVARGAENVLVLRHLTADNPDRCCLSVEQAVRLASLPLFVLVENVVNDAQFLRVVMPAAWRKRLQEWESTGVLCFENGGGVAVMKTIVERFADDNQPDFGPFGLPPAAWRAAHFVLFDRDGDPSSPGDQTKKLQQACKKHSMTSRSHMLLRRNQESYLPQEALAAIVRQKGLSDDKQEQIKASLSAHFAQPEAEQHFAKLPGLGKKPLFKNQFGALTDSPDPWFEDCWPEMTALAEKIAAVI